MSMNMEGLTMTLARRRSLMKFVLPLGAVAVTAACAGFYRIPDVPQAETAAGDRVSDLRYLTATVDLHNKTVLTSKEYREERDSDLEYLYIYAEFDHPAFGKSVIPLFLLNLKNGSLEETKGAELISKFPLRPDRRGKPFVVFRTAALEKSGADIALQVFQDSKTLIDGALKSVGPAGPYAVKAVDVAANLVQAVASKEYRYQVSTAVPATYSNATFAQGYLVVPTDSDGNILHAADQEIRSLDGKLSVCRSGGGSGFVCHDDGTPYRRYPYILIDFRLTDYIDDPLLLPQVFAPNCSNVSQAILDQASATLLLPDRLSPEQVAQERALVDHAQAYLAMTTEVHGKKYPEAVNAYEAYSFLNRSSDSFYLARFKARYDVLDQCIATGLASIPGGDVVLQLTKASHGTVELDKQAEESLEEMLRGLSVIVDVAQQQAFLFLQDTRLYQRALARVRGVERFVFAKWYKADVDVLRRKPSQAQAWTVIARLEAKVQATNCSLCRSEASQALADYNSSVLSQKLASVEVERLALQEDASKLRSALAVRETSLGLLNSEQAAELAEAAATIKRLQDEVNALAAGTKEREDSTRELRESLVAARNILRPDDGR